MCNSEKSKCKRTISFRLSKRAADFNFSYKKIPKTTNSNFTIDNTSESKSIITSIETEIESFASISRLGHSFFNQPCISLAKSLLGKLLVRKLDTGEILKGKIVETES